MFDVHIGIDYSGADTPNKRNRRLQVCRASGDGPPQRVVTPAAASGRCSNWNRKEIALWLVSLAEGPHRFIVGIDHAFSFPMPYLDRYDLRDWDAFLRDFREHWPTHEDGVRVDDFRIGNSRAGNPEWFRVTELRNKSAKSVFNFDAKQGQVAKSTHAGLPFLLQIREHVGTNVHFWPFDGWDIPEGKPAIVEVYPRLLRGLRDMECRTPDERDACAVARWLSEMDCRELLKERLHPSLTGDELDAACREGWILGAPEERHERPSGT